MNRRSSRGASLATLAVLGLAVGAGACATTEMKSTWTDPASKGAMLSKVAVICLHKDQGLRRMCEDASSSRLTGAQAVPSYQVLSETDLRDRRVVASKLKEQGFQGVLVMRIAGVTQQVSAPDEPYGPFESYYDWAGNAVFDPAVVETDTIVHMVSNLYSLQDGKLIWSGVSETFDPASAQSFMKGVSKAVAKSMQKDRLVL